MLPLFMSIFILSVANSYEPWLNDFDYHTFMDGSDQKYEVYWNADQNECVLEIGVAVQTDGWVGFGISQNGVGMANSDIAIGWVTADNHYILSNRYGTGFSPPQLFADQSHLKKIDAFKRIVNGTTMTYLRFEKEMFPDFDPMAVSIKIGTSKVIWAFRDDELTDDAEPSMHLPCAPGSTSCTRGIESMNLLQGESVEKPLPPDAMDHDVYFENVQVSNSDTTYFCSLHKLPQLDVKHHIIRIDPLIQPDNIGVVHHMLLYICPEHMINQSHVGRGYDCDAIRENMPGTDCLNGIVFFGWAVGGKNFYFPDDVGMEMSGSESDAIQYVLLQTHYDNPTQRDDIIDSSGLKLWYTPTLRPMSAAMLMIGMQSNSDAIFIPPGIDKATLYGYCFMDCMTAGIEATDDDKIYAIANILHSHLLGRQMILRHIRNDKELRPLDMNLAYDFDYQQITPFTEQVQILPGDQLIVECIYDSSARDFITWGGESTNEEMCLSFLMVYPKPRMAHCGSKFLGEWNEETGEGTEDLGRFWNEAYQRGYMDMNSTAFYDVTMDGALDFYNEFQQGNIFDDSETGTGALRSQQCWDWQREPIVEGDTINSVLRSDIEYGSFDDDDYYVCGVGGQESKGFEWDGWYVYLVGTLIVVILIVAVVCIIVRVNSKNKTKDMYHKVLGKQQNNYGTKKTEDKQISMQDRM